MDKKQKMNKEHEQINTENRIANIMAQKAIEAATGKDTTLSAFEQKLAEREIENMIEKLKG